MAASWLKNLLTLRATGAKCGPKSVVLPTTTNAFSLPETTFFCLSPSSPYHRSQQPAEPFHPVARRCFCTGEPAGGRGNLRQLLRSFCRAAAPYFFCIAGSFSATLYGRPRVFWRGLARLFGAALAVHRRGMCLLHSTIPLIILS